MKNQEPEEEDMVTLNMRATGQYLIWSHSYVHNKLDLIPSSLSENNELLKKIIKVMKKR